MKHVLPPVSSYPRGRKLPLHMVHHALMALRLQTSVPALEIYSDSHLQIASTPTVLRLVHVQSPGEPKVPLQSRSLIIVEEVAIATYMTNVARSRH